MDKGRSIDELWRVAEAKWKYHDYLDKVVRPLVGDAYSWRARQARQQSPSPPPPPQQQQAQQKQRVERRPMPEDLLAVMAYVLWERAGKPQGADFSNDARREIESRVGNGLTYEDIAAQLKYTPKWSAASTTSSVDEGDRGGAKGAVAAPAKQQPAAPPPPPQPAQVGKPLGAPSRNPLDMIKVREARGLPATSRERGQRGACGTVHVT